jgi:multidrug efflux system outer membrane protein
MRFEAGADDLLSLLQTEQARIELEDSAVQAQTARTTALAALYKALAGDFAEAQTEATAQGG